MPSPSHQAFALLFRTHPHLAFELARRAGAPVRPPYGRIRAVPTDFDDPFRPGRSVVADLAFVTDSDAVSKCGILLEVQLDRDQTKEWTIILYRAAMRSRNKCPVWAAVFSPNERVRRQFLKRMFRREPELRPQIITPDMIELIDDLETAMQDYAWAILSLAMHPCGVDVVVRAKVTIQAILRVEPEEYGSYLQLVINSVGEDVMQQVRAELPTDDLIVLSEWERRGSAFTHGHAEGIRLGREQGRLEAARAALHCVMEARGLSVDADARSKIAAADLRRLQLLIARAAQVDSTAALFG